MRALAAGVLAALLSSAALADNTDTAQPLVSLTAQGAGTVASADVTNSSNGCLVAVVNITAILSASVVVHIQGKDFVSGSYYDILVGPALTTTGLTPMYVCRGIVGGANSVALPTPRTWRVTAVVTGGSASVTGTIGASQTE